MRPGQTCAREGCRFHRWENGCCGACSGLTERDGVHREAYPEDTGDELSTGARQHGYEEYNRSQRSRVRGGEHVPGACGDAPGSADGRVALLLACGLLDVVAARIDERGKWGGGTWNARAGVIFGQAMLEGDETGDGRDGRLDGPGTVEMKGVSECGAMEGRRGDEPCPGRGDGCT